MFLWGVFRSKSFQVVAPLIFLCWAVSEELKHVLSDEKLKYGKEKGKSTKLRKILFIYMSGSHYD